MAEKPTNTAPVPKLPQGTVKTVSTKNSLAHDASVSKGYGGGKK